MIVDAVTTAGVSQYLNLAETLANIHLFDAAGRLRIEGGLLRLESPQPGRMARDEVTEVSG